MEMRYPFGSDDLLRAYKEWGCNCGPAALAFALQIGLDAVRKAIPDFEAKRFTSPTMMQQAMAALRKEYNPVPVKVKGEPSRANLFDRVPALVRIQWGGPWTAPGGNPKWAYRHTHWIATWKAGVHGDATVFDVNSGIVGFPMWEMGTVPQLIESIPRADGTWWPTHIWRIGHVRFGA
jgi:hypothetical protein